MTTGLQFWQLVSSMEEFPHLATGTPQFGNCKSAMQYTWETVATKGNAYEPPFRNGSEWKKSLDQSQIKKTCKKLVAGLAMSTPPLINEMIQLHQEVKTSNLE